MCEFYCNKVNKTSHPNPGVRPPETAHHALHDPLKTTFPSNLLSPHTARARVAARSLCLPVPPPAPSLFPLPRCSCPHFPTWRSILSSSGGLNFFPKASQTLLTSSWTPSPAQTVPHAGSSGMVISPSPTLLSPPHRLGVGSDHLMSVPGTK